PEVRFLYRKSERVLPVWLDGELQICRWGNRRGESRRLPCTAWTWLKTVEAGGWAGPGAGGGGVPAAGGAGRGGWGQIRRGGREGRGNRVVSVLVEPPSHYYQVMTRSTWMPVLIDERI